MWFRKQTHAIESDGDRYIKGRTDILDSGRLAYTFSTTCRDITNIFINLKHNTEIWSKVYRKYQLACNLIRSAPHDPCTKLYRTENVCSHGIFNMFQIYIIFIFSYLSGRIWFITTPCVCRSKTKRLWSGS